MNKDLRFSCLKNSWSKKEILLDYLRVRGVFTHPNGNQNANPYWYRSILEYKKLETEITQLLVNKSIKKSRMLDLAQDMEEDYLSPIVRLTGMIIKEIVK